LLLHGVQRPDDGAVRAAQEFGYFRLPPVRKKTDIDFAKILITGDLWDGQFLKYLKINYLDPKILITKGLWTDFLHNKGSWADEGAQAGLSRAGGSLRSLVTLGYLR
jgi:hypothetical protein